MIENRLPPVQTNKTHGFSLVELSIVLVILGLLVGGIMTGQNLIHAAELRSITSEVNNYRTAVHLFRDKYLAIPGDMRNAHDFWDDGADGVCGTAAECNGNGDGSLVADNTANDQENYRFWQHLTLAGMITGDYTGTGEDGTPAGNCVTGLNVPKAKIGSAGYIAHAMGGNFGGIDFAETPIMLQIGNPPNTDFTFCQDNGALSPEDAWNLDTKMDDGQADTGRVYMLNGNGSTGCLVDQGTDNSFLLNNTGKNCRGFFEIL